MITTLEAKQLVYSWYKKLDEHADISEIIPLLAEDGLEIQLPEATYTTIDEFKEWYKTVTNLFFNETHDLKMLDIEISGDEAIINLVVNWQTEVWNPPAAKSIWKGFDCFQKWIAVKDQKTDKLLIKQYIVEKLIPMLDSPAL